MRQSYELHRWKYTLGFRHQHPGRRDRRRDFSDQRVPDRCDLHRLAGTVLVDPADVHGTGRPVRHRDGSGHGLQDDGEARAARRDETVPPAGRLHHPLLVVSAGRYRHGRQRKQLVLPGLPVLHTELYRLVHA